MKDTVHVRLGHGVYSLAEVSRLTGLDVRRVRHWFATTSNGVPRRPVFEADFPEIEDDLAVSFHDLIDVYVAGLFRQRGVSLHVVRKAYEVLKHDLQTDHPFCHEALYTDGTRIFIGLVNPVEDEAFTEVVTRQHYIPTLIKEYLSKIDYCAASQLAARWNIRTGVVIDPAVNFGKPVVENTNVSTWVLANSYFANGQDARLVAGLFGVEERDVLIAVTFSKEYELVKAA